MAPEYPPELVIFDSRFEEGKLKGDLHYVEVPIGNRLRVRWDSEREPENFQPVGGGVAYVSKSDQLVVLPVSRDSIPDDLGGLRYRWSEGLNFGIPWVMFVLILPSAHTLVAAEPMPARAKIFKGRLALYWILRADDLGRTQVECALKAFEGSASPKLVELNRFCSGESPPLDGSIQIEDRSPSTSKRVFISYSHDSDTHREQVLSLSQRLRADGIETLLDRYVNAAPPQGWPRWMLDQLDAADSVLVVCTETYYRRFRGHEEPGKGKGVDWEGALITSELYEARSRTVKFVPVLLSAAGENWIPEPLRSGTHFALTSEAAYANLYDFLLEQAGVEPHPVGTLKPKSRRKGTALTFGEPPPSENASAENVERKPSSGTAKTPIYFCYISQEKVDQLVGEFHPREFDVSNDAQSSSVVECHFASLVNSEFNYGRPDLYERNVEFRRSYAAKLRTLARELIRVTKPLVEANNNAFQEGTFFWFKGKFRVKKFDQEQGIATLSSRWGRRELLLDCSLRYFSSAASAGGTFSLNSANYAFFSDKVPLTLETVFILLARSARSYRGSPLYLQLAPSGMTAL